jgi:hypothetical protein
MFTCLNVSSSMLPSMALADTATHSTAEAICEAAEVLVMLTNGTHDTNRLEIAFSIIPIRISPFTPGALMHADNAFSIKCSKHVVKLLERLEFEFPTQIRTSLVRLDADLSLHWSTDSGLSCSWSEVLSYDAP